MQKRRCFRFIFLLFLIASLSGCSIRYAYWLDTSIPKMQVTDIAPAGKKKAVHVSVEWFYGKEIDILSVISNCAFRQEIVCCHV